jgi:hypothetical protein
MSTRCGKVYDAEASVEWMDEKWAYSLVEYELSYEPLKAVKGQVVANFIVDHGIQFDDVGMVAKMP